MIEAIDTVFNWILNEAGVAIMMPLIIFTLAILFRAPVGKAFKAAVSIAVGFTGLFLVLGMLIDGLAPATQAMSDRLNLGLTITDAGWPTLAAISFGTRWAFTLFLVIFALNILLILVRFTKTLNVDLWNYWSFAYVFAMVWIVTENFPLATVGAVAYALFCFKLADWTQPVLERHFKMPGLSLPHGDSVVWAPIGFALDRLWDKVPGIRDIRIEPEGLQRRLGVFGNPMVLGLLIGVAVGALAYVTFPLPADAVNQVLQLGVVTAAFMVLMPRMVALLMEGLLPISEAVRVFVTRRFPGRELYIGVDAAVVVGNPAIVATALVMTPLTLLIAGLLPGNAVLPFADLAVLVFLLIWAVAPSGGDIFRGILNGVLVFIPLVLLVATNVAPEVTAVAGQVGADIPADGQISALATGFKILSWPILVTMWAIGGAAVSAVDVALAVGALALYGLLWWLVFKRPAQRFGADATPSSPTAPAMARQRGEQVGS